MTIVLKETARRITRRRKTKSGGPAPVEPVRFSCDRATRKAQIRALVTAPLEVREATLRASVEAAPFYAASLQNGGELTETTRALQDESFRDD